MVNLITLNNGLRIVYHPDKTRHKTGFSICLNVGSINERRTKNSLIKGIAHFTEHLMFKSNEQKHYEELYKSLGWKGTNYNAETGLCHTNFYGSTKSSIEDVLETFYEAYTFSDYNCEEFENEKKVVLNEILEHESTVKNIMTYKLLIPSLYQNTRLSRNIVGDTRLFKKINLEDIKKFKKKFYTPKNTVIGLTGNFDMRSLKPFLERTFGSLEPSKKNTSRFNPKLSPFYGSIIKNLPGIIPSTHLMTAFLAPRETDKNYILADFLNDILSLDYSSRMNLELREKRGIGYKLGVEYDESYGYLCFYVDNFLPEQLAEAKDAINTFIEDILLKGISHEEIDGVKELVISHYLSDESDLVSLAKSLTEQEAFKLPYNITDIEKKLKRVTPYQLNRFAKKLFRQNKLEIIVNST